MEMLSGGCGCCAVLCAVACAPGWHLLGIVDVAGHFSRAVVRGSSCELCKLAAAIKQGPQARVAVHGMGRGTVCHAALKPLTPLTPPAATRTSKRPTGAGVPT